VDNIMKAKNKPLEVLEPAEPVAAVPELARALG
jgi:hypothetical protein